MIHREDITALGYWAANWARIGNMGLRMGPRGILRNLPRYPWLKTMLRVNELHDRLTHTRHGRYKEANAFLISNVLHSITDKINGVFARPDRVVLHEDLVPPELLFAMDLQPWMAEFLGIVLPMVENTRAEPYIDVAENAGIPADVCSLPKSTIGLTLSGEMPPARAIVASNMPCDGGMTQYTLIERYMQAPCYRLDVPHNFYDDRAVGYFADQLRELISWLEAHTPGRMDWDRLREICEERNRAVEAEFELWDLLRARPAPLAAEPIYLSHLMYGIAWPGTPRGTRVFRRLYELGLQNLKDGIGALDDERHRVALWNPPTLIFVDLHVWAEQAFGVSMIMDMLTYHRHPFIDTRTPESMLQDLSRCIMQGPMARHTRGPAVNFFSDLFTFYEYFDLDMIWMAAHIGCKNTQALSGMFRERCRERGIPLLFIDYDLSDTRIASTESIRTQVERFMQTVMQAERLDRGAQSSQERKP